MGSETTLKLPVIDFNGLDLEAKNHKWEEVKSQVIKALKEYGCFEALFDEVPLELRKSLFVVLKELFDLPHETKIKNVYEIPYYGYLGKGPRSPLYESIGIDEANVLENVESMEKILWPEGYPSFRSTQPKVFLIICFFYETRFYFPGHRPGSDHFKSTNND